MNDDDEEESGASKAEDDEDSEAEEDERETNALIRRYWVQDKDIRPKTPKELTVLGMYASLHYNEIYPAVGHDPYKGRDIARQRFLQMSLKKQRHYNYAVATIKLDFECV